MALAKRLAGSGEGKLGQGHGREQDREPGMNFWLALSDCRTLWGPGVHVLLPTSSPCEPLNTGSVFFPTFPSFLMWTALPDDFQCET